MHNVSISTDRIYLDFSDSSEEPHNSPDTENTELKRYLDETLKVLSNFFWSNHLGLPAGKVEEVELSLTICDDVKIQELNRDYREKDKVTDVLSFPVHDSLRPKMIDEIFIDKILNLGDVIICKSVAIKQAVEFKITYEQEIIHLFIHGVLHVCGYDHEISKIEEDIMFELEEKLVEEIYKNLGL